MLVLDIALPAATILAEGFSPSPQFTANDVPLPSLEQLLRFLMPFKGLWKSDTKMRGRQLPNMASASMAETKYGVCTFVVMAGEASPGEMRIAARLRPCGNSEATRLLVLQLRNDIRATKARIIRSIGHRLATHHLQRYFMSRQRGTVNYEGFDGALADP